MPTQNAIHDQLELLAAHRRTLAVYLKRQALMSRAQVAPEVSHGITDAQAAIRQIKATLHSWGVAVEDIPDDDIQAGNVVPSEPHTGLDRAEYALFWRWVQATIIGGVAGTALGQMIQMAVTLSLCTVMGDTERYFVGWLIGGLFAGGLIGVFQGAVLRERLPLMAWWIVATAAGFGIGWAVRDWQGWRLGQAFGDAGYVVGWALAGLIIGCAQALVLRRFIAGARWLVVAQIVASIGWWYGSVWASDALNTGSVMVGWDMLNAWRGDISMCMESANAITGPLGNVVWGLPTGMVGGISAGVLTGAALVILLRGELKQQSRQPDIQPASTTPPQAR